MKSFLKYNFIDLFQLYKPYFLYITILDLIFLSSYLTIFHFNKYIHYGSDPIYFLSNDARIHLDLTNCLSVITIKNSEHIFIDERILNINELNDYINKWPIKHNSYVIINFDQSHNNIKSLFLVMDVLSIHNIPRVYIS